MKDVIEITRDLIQIESTNPGKEEGDIAKYILSFLRKIESKIMLNGDVSEKVSDKSINNEMEIGGESTDNLIEIVLDEVSPKRYNIIATIMNTKLISSDNAMCRLDLPSFDNAMCRLDLPSFDNAMCELDLPSFDNEICELDLAFSDVKSFDTGTLPMLVFICHMDTVVAGKDWTRNPFGAKIENGRIYGRGACDMKSGLACAIRAFCKTALDIKEKKRKITRPLRLICTVDEEGFMTGVEHIIERGYVKKNDFVLDLEPTDKKIQMAHKGRLWLEVTVHGVTAHASKPEEGADAVAAAANIICKMREEFEKFPIHEEMGKSTITFGQIKGGYQPYVVPDECKIWMDCRLAPPIQREHVTAILCEKIREVEGKMQGIQVEFEITGDRPYIERNPSSYLAKCLQKAVRNVTKEECVMEAFSGYTDTAVIAGKLGNRECMSYGPGSLKYAHKPDEFVEILDIQRCENVLLQLIKYLCN